MKNNLEKTALPENKKEDKQTIIVQPNKVTNIIFNGFTLIQHRVITTIMLLLQEAIKKDMQNKDYKQLQLFNAFEENINITLPLKEIVKNPQDYGDVKQAIIKMAEINVKIPEYDQTGKLYHIIGNLFTAKIPDKPDYNSRIFIKIDKTIANHLIHINKDQFGNPNQFTKYIYEVAQNTSSIYSILLYKFISSWKKREGVTVPYKELRELLYLEEESYKEFKDFKKRILLPAQNELKQKADCWFNCEDAGFKITKKNNDGKKEIYLNFKIISRESIILEETKRKQCYNMLTTHFQFKEADFKELTHILENEKIKIIDIFNKIVEIAESIAKNKQIASIRAYAKQSLLNHKFIK